MVRTFPRLHNWLFPYRTAFPVYLPKPLAAFAFIHHIFLNKSPYLLSRFQILQLRRLLLITIQKTHHRLCLHPPDTAFIHHALFTLIGQGMPVKRRLLIPLALKGVKYRELPADRLLARNLLLYGCGGIVTPFVCIKLIDMVISLWI